MNLDSANIKKIKQIYLACLITGFLSVPTISVASNFISLTDREKELINRGDIIVREIGTAGKDGKTFEAIGIINASRETVLQVLTEYEKYPEFMPNISHIEIIEQVRDELILNYTLTLPLGKIKKYRLRIFSTQPENQSSMIQWQLTKWPGLKTEETIKDTNGYWYIKEKTQDISLVLYHVYTDPGPIPFGLGWIVDILSKDSVPEALLQTKARSEKMTQKANEP